MDRRLASSSRDAPWAYAPTRQVADLYDRLGETAFSLCLVIVGDKDAAADIVCECFRTAPADATGDWLLGETRRRAASEARATSAAGRHDAAARATQPLRAFPMLNGEQRRVLGLVYFRGLTISETAKRLAITHQRAASTLATAMEKIPGRHRSSSSPQNLR
jgi:DNA-directed RNA polymerase specialized sigma24 family protein